MLPTKQPNDLTDDPLARLMADTDPAIRGGLLAEVFAGGRQDGPEAALRLQQFMDRGNLEQSLLSRGVGSGGAADASRLLLGMGQKMDWEREGPYRYKAGGMARQDLGRPGPAPAPTISGRPLPPKSGRPQTAQPGLEPEEPGLDMEPLRKALMATQAFQGLRTARAAEMDRAPGRAQYGSFGQGNAMNALGRTEQAERARDRQAESDMLGRQMNPTDRFNRPGLGRPGANATPEAIFRDTLLFAQNPTRGLSQIQLAERALGSNARSLNIAEQIKQVEQQGGDQAVAIPALQKLRQAKQIQDMDTKRAYADFLQREKGQIEAEALFNSSGAQKSLLAHAVDQRQERTAKAVANRLGLTRIQGPGGALSPTEQVRAALSPRELDGFGAALASGGSPETAIGMLTEEAQARMSGLVRPPQAEPVQIGGGGEDSESRMDAMIREQAAKTADPDYFYQRMKSNLPRKGEAFLTPQERDAKRMQERFETPEERFARAAKESGSEELAALATEAEGGAKAAQAKNVVRLKDGTRVHVDPKTGEVSAIGDVLEAPSREGKTEKPVTTYRIDGDGNIEMVPGKRPGIEKVAIGRTQAERDAYAASLGTGNVVDHRGKPYGPILRQKEGKALTPEQVAEAKGVSEARSKTMAAAERLDALRKMSPQAQAAAIKDMTKDASGAVKAQTKEVARLFALDSMDEAGDTSRAQKHLESLDDKTREGVEDALGLFGPDDLSRRAKEAAKVRLAPRLQGQVNKIQTQSGRLASILRTLSDPTHKPEWTPTERLRQQEAARKMFADFLQTQPEHAVLAWQQMMGFDAVDPEDPFAALADALKEG